MPRASGGAAPKQTPAGKSGLSEFDAETTSNPSAEEIARRERVAAKGEEGDLPGQQTARYGADKEGGAGTWFLDLDDDEEFLRICWYGAEGSTKTTNLAEAANAAAAAGSKLLVIDAEAGVKKKALQRRGIDTSAIRYWPNHRAGEKITRKGLEQVFHNLQSDLEEDKNSWFGVGIDSFTEVTYAMIQGAQARRVRMAKNQGKTLDPEFMDRADYGQAAKWLAQLIRNYRVLPCHLLVTALLRRDVDEDSGKVKYGPATSPAVQNDLAGMMDVLIMVKGADAEGPIRGLTQTTGKYRAKDRFGCTPRVLVEPTFGRYLAYYEDRLTAANDPEQKRLVSKGAAGKGSGDAELDTSEELEAD